MSFKLNAVYNNQTSHKKIVTPTATPAAGYVFSYIDTATGLLTTKDESAAVKSYLPSGASISPAQITAHTNDYNPTGFSTINGGTMLINLSANFDITGFVAQVEGFTFVIFNTTIFDAKLKNQNANSAAANRIFLNADLTIKQYQTATLRYSTSQGGWICVGAQLN